MKYTFHIVDVFSSAPFGGNQLAVLPNAAGISTEGMQKASGKLETSRRRRGIRQSIVSPYLPIGCEAFHTLHPL
jgi:Phenazine biosynthesis-like protein